MAENWSERDTELYQRLIDVAVPRRSTQLATLLTLLPMNRSAPSRVVELGCGTGALSFAILDAFQHCEVLALDGSQRMLRHTADKLKPFAERLTVERFDLDSAHWHHHLGGVDAVVSSLAIHHLDGDQKRALFATVHDALSEGGALLIADLVEPQRREASELFAASWESSAKRRAERRQQPELYDLFRTESWNLYQHPDPADKPSPLFDQLCWLKETGFESVDCFWLQAGHAIYGGYRNHGREHDHEPLAYSRALESVRRAVSRTSP